MSLRIPNARHRCLAASCTAVLASLWLGAGVATASSIHTAAGSFGGASSTVPDPYPLAAPTDVAIDESAGGDHDIYVTDPGHFRVEKFDAEGHFLLMFGKEVNKTKVHEGASEAEQAVCTAASGDECQSGVQATSGDGAFSDPAFVAVDSSEGPSAGDVYVGDAGTVTVYKFTSAGAFLSENDGASTTVGTFHGVDGITTDKTGKLWVFDSFARVFRFAPDGTTVEPFFDTGGARPDGVKVDDAGNIYVVSGLEALEEYSPTNHLVGKLMPGPFDDGTPPTGFALSPTTEDLYADTGAEITHILPGCIPTDINGVRTFCPIADVFGFPFISKGRGVAVDGRDQSVLVADEGSNSVPRFADALEALTGAGAGTSATEANVHAAINAEGTTVVECGFEYGPSEEYGQSVPCEETVGSGRAPVNVDAHLSGLKGGRTYHYRAFARSAAGVVMAEDETFTTAQTPVIEAAAAQNITADTAELVAKINPSGLDTRYRFEYGTGTNYETSVPIPDQDIGAGTGSAEVTQRVSGLQEETTYHFRVVATDANGTEVSPDHTFVFLTPERSVCANEALRSGPSAGLPDCRGYELVTPPKKDAALIGVFAFGTGLPTIAEDGSHLVVASIQCFAEAESCIAHRASEGELYEFSREPGGWQPQPLAPPASEFQTESVWSYRSSQGNYLFSSPNQLGEENFYVREPSGAFRHVGPMMDESESGVSHVRQSGLVATTDFSTFVYGTDRPFWAFDHGASEAHGLYEYSDANSNEPSLVAVSGGPGSTDLIGSCGSGIGNDGLSSANLYNSLSEDGRIVYFTVSQCMTGSGANKGKKVAVDSLYARADETRTIAIATAVPATCTTVECQDATPEPSVFEGASRDGERALFTSTQQLTDGASQDRHAGDAASRCLRTAPAAPGCNLYMSVCPEHCEQPANRTLVDVSEGAANTEGPKVQGVVAISANADHVYYVAKGVLTTAENQLGEHAQAGAENLYLYERDSTHPEGRVSFIARLAAEDQIVWADNSPFENTVSAVTSQGLGVANLTPDGRDLVFPSHRGLTADAASGPAQIYRYDSQTEQMTRISVGKRGFNDNGNAGKADAKIVQASYAFASGAGPARANPTMSNDGSYVFFVSPVALTPNALNEVETGGIEGNAGKIAPELAENIYEYHDGDVSLISDGKDVSESGKAKSRTPELLGTDATGENVFFATNSQLTGKDTDTQRDYYDARIDGGEPQETQPSVCENDACREPVTAPPVFGALTSTLIGPTENLSPSTTQTKPKPKPVTKAEQLRKALRRCRAKYKHARRARCERAARHKYAPHKAKRAKKLNGAQHPTETAK